ncbi:mycofactocin-coupled SDR family oxidoreductase [Rhodococcus koreensis]
MKRLENKVAFITGAARGQGRAHAVRMASEGADIIAIDCVAPLPGVPYESSTPADLEETARLIKAEGREIVSAQCDVRDLEAMRTVVGGAVAELGGLDIVVANAGICIPATWDGTTPEQFRDHMDINVTGVWNTVIASASHLVARGQGSIIITSSYAGKKMQPFMVAYTTSKHAVTGMTRAFAAELGKHNVRVNSIHPGAVATPMGSEDMITALQRVTETNPTLGIMGTPFLPQRAAEPNEIADTVLFLASDDSRYISGEHISIDGGAQYF